MLHPQKGLVHFLLAVIAVGGLNCPCPATAIEGAEAQTHHAGHAEPPAIETDGCEDAACAGDCDAVAAESSRKDAAFPCAAKSPFDPDFDAMEAAAMPWLADARPVVWIEPPPRRIRLTHDTPIGRFDRLLV